MHEDFSPDRPEAAERATDPADARAQRRRLLIGAGGLAALAPRALSAAADGDAGPAAATERRVPREAVSVRDFGAVGDGTADDAAAFQAAIRAAPTVRVPLGTYRLGRTLSMGRQTNLIGEHEKLSVLRATHGGVVLEYPEDNLDPRLQNLLIDAPGGTGVAVAAGKGPLQSYLIGAQFDSVHFTHAMAYGIDANCIFARLRKCSFGYEGAGRRAGTLCALRSFSSKANYTNLNRLEACIFHLGNAAPASVAVQVRGGDLWVFEGCDFEFCGRVAQFDNVSQLRFSNCWFEANGGADWLVDVGTSLSPALFENCNFTNNASAACIRWNSRAGAGLVVRYCLFGLPGGNHPVIDAVTGSVLPDGGGKLVWDSSRVSGGAPEARALTPYHAGATAQVRAWFVCDTRGAGSIVAASHPGIAVSGRPGTGELLVRLPFPAAASAERLCVVATSGTAGVRAGPLGAADAVRISAYAPAGAAPVDAVVSVMLLGN